MIIFCNKHTGDIEGTIDGRIHPEPDLKMWIGDPNETIRIIIEWKPVKYFDKDSKEVDPVKNREEVFAAEFQPDHPQKELIQYFDNNKREILKYKIDLKTMRLIPKD